MKTSKKTTAFGFPYNSIFAFSYVSNRAVKFNTIEPPIKYINHDKKTNSLTDKAKFGNQFFTSKDGLPDEALSSVIYVNSARHLRNIKIQLRENL